MIEIENLNDIKDLTQIWNVRHNRFYYTSVKISLQEEIDIYMKLLKGHDSEIGLKIYDSDLEERVNIISILKVPNNIFNDLRELKIVRGLRHSYDIECNRWRKVLIKMKKEETHESEYNKRLVRFIKVLEHKLEDSNTNIKSDKYNYLWNGDIGYSTPLEVKNKAIEDLRELGVEMVKYQALRMIVNSLKLDCILNNRG